MNSIHQSVFSDADERKNSTKRLRLIFLFNAIYFVAISDITSVSVGGGNIRLAWALLPFLIMWTPRQKHRLAPLAVLLAFFCVHVIAALFAGTIVRGVVYSSWIIFNYIFFFRPAYKISLELKEGIWDAFLWGGRVQIVVAVILVAIGVHERARFIYFEPSYFAMGLVPYIFCAVFRSKQRAFDAGLISLGVIFSQSANLLIALLIVGIFWLISNRKVVTTLLLLLVAAIVASVGFINALNDQSNPNHGVVAWIADNGINWDLVEVILTRSGNRIPRIQAAIEVIGSEWIFGLGPGNYSDLSEKFQFDELSGGLEYLDPTGMPVINVLLEATANAGIFAAAIILVIYLYYLRRAWRTTAGKQRLVILGSLITYGVMLQFESSYLRAYVWMAFGVFSSKITSISTNTKFKLSNPLSGE